MTNEEAKELYGRAVELVEGSQFAEALTYLDRVEAERPNSRHVMYYRARCLAELGRVAEAREGLQKIEGKIEQARLDEVRGRISAKLSESQASQSSFLQAPAPAADSGANVFLIESAFPVAMDQTTVTGRVISGLFRVGDTLTLVSKDGMPTVAPIVRIGSAETPINLVRAGQQAVLLLQAEPQYVMPGTSATSETQDESYAKTMVVSVDAPMGASRELQGGLADAERLLKRGKHAEAKELIESDLALEKGQWPAHWILARVYLESEPPLLDAKKALECVRDAYELGGAEDPGVIYTLAQALAANGEAAQGLRFLERLHDNTPNVDVRTALSRRIQEFRMQHRIGHVWEFSDQFGEVLFTAVSMKEVVNALSSGAVPRDAKCRRDHLGDWRPMQEVLGSESPEVTALFQPAETTANAVLWVLIGILGMAVVAAILFVFRR